MATYFISDLHLTEDRPDITAGLYALLQQIADDASKLYIIGDLFEYWVGDDCKTPLTIEVARKLKGLADKGISIFYIHGNRDFMIGKKFAAEAGMQLLKEHTIIDLYGKNVLILHGDTLCIDDEAYQNYRNKVRQPFRQKLFSLLPRFIRQKVADKIRSSSRQAKKGKNLQIMDVNPGEVERFFTEFKVDTMIHGHTHRPKVHQLQVNNMNCRRIVLGDWDKNISYVRARAEDLELMTLPLAEDNR